MTASQHNTSVKNRENNNAERKIIHTDILTEVQQSRLHVGCRNNFSTAKSIFSNNLSAFLYIYLFIITLLSQWKLFPWEIRGAFLEVSQLRQSRYPTLINY